MAYIIFISLLLCINFPKSNKNILNISHVICDLVNSLNLVFYSLLQYAHASILLSIYEVLFYLDEEAI